MTLVSKNAAPAHIVRFPTTAADAYGELKKRFARLSVLKDIRNLLHWDMSAVMPTGAAARRADQMALMTVLEHQILTDPALDDLLSLVESDVGGFGPWDSANLREMRRLWRHQAVLDSPLVEAFSRAVSTCEMVWRQARPENDFAAIIPSLQVVRDRVRDIAVIKGEAMGLTPYDALLDEFEPGGRTAMIDPLFEDLSAFLPPFLTAVLERQADSHSPLPLPGVFPIAKQRQLARALMSHLGFDFDRGRLDVSLHPFCGGGPEDTRITTRYDESNFLSALMAVLHETGHALYEQSLPSKWHDQPVGRVHSMVLHESQSLLIEMQVCRSRAFAVFAAPLIAKAFGGSGAAWSADNFYRLNKQVNRDLIRVDADEVTYPAHVILRYRLERDMLSGKLAIADLPEAWNAGMSSLIGVTPPDDRDGCLQDIHWFDGAWGYFPTYTLGALAAAQLFESLSGTHDMLLEAVAVGDFAPLLQCLREKIHIHGGRFETDDLMREVTGQPLGVAAFKAHLARRYGEAA